MSPCFRCAIVALIATGLFIAIIVWAESPTAPVPETDRIPVMQMQLDGSITLQSIELPPSPIPGFFNYVCFREFEAKEISCYLINATARRAIRLDLPLEE